MPSLWGIRALVLEDDSSVFKMKKTHYLLKYILFMMLFSI